MRYFTLVAPICILAFQTNAKAAECEPAFVGADQAVVIDGVEIEPGARATENFQVRVQNTAGVSGGASAGSSSSPAGSAPCIATIRVARLGTTTNTDLPPYSLSAPGNQNIEILPDPSSGGTGDSDVAIANAPPGPQGRSVPFRISVPTDWGVHAGTYIEQLQLLLIDSEGNIVDRSPLTVTIVIPAAISLRLVGAVIGSGNGGPARVDLGSLSSVDETHSDPFAALVLSTSPYLVKFSSINLGNLMHEQGRDQIPYRLFYDNSLIDLAGISEIPFPQKSQSGGDTRPMSILVPPVVALAGRYSDRILITVTTM